MAAGSARSRERPSEKLHGREAKKEDKRRRIRWAAAELFRKQGYDATTTRAIAERAGVATGTLFLYVRDKDEALALVYGHEVDDAHRLLDLDRGPHAVEDPEEPHPRRVQPDALDPDAAAGHDQRGDDQERGRREVARHLELERCEPIGGGDPDPARRQTMIVDPDARPIV